MGLDLILEDEQDATLNGRIPLAVLWQKIKSQDTNGNKPRLNIGN